MTILVCGGAGYIGSHAVAALLAKGEQVVIVDHLQTGHKEAVLEGAVLEEGDLRDQAFLRQVFNAHQIEAVMHFAADSLVGESVTDPLKYFDNNVGGATALLQVMNEFDVKRIVFSSTAAVYGEPKRVPIVETDETSPTNPYGETKLAIEKMLKWSEQAYGLEYVVLRYFNVAGAHIAGLVGEDHQPETHLIPIILQVALGKRDQMMIYGDDYETEDGTCIRDYIHVVDLAKAHLVALERLLNGENPDNYEVFNVGTGEGSSVLEVIASFERVSGKKLNYSIVERRAGDVTAAYADTKKANEILGWKSGSTLDQAMKSAWDWERKIRS